MAHHHFSLSIVSLSIINHTIIQTITKKGWSYQCRQFAGGCCMVHTKGHRITCVQGRLPKYSYTLLLSFMSPNCFLIKNYRRCIGVQSNHHMTGVTTFDMISLLQTIIHTSAQSFCNCYASMRSGPNFQGLTYADFTITNHASFVNTLT